MDLLDLFVKISVDDKASGQMEGLSAGMIAKGQLIASGVQAAVSTAISAIKQLVGGAVNAYSQYEQLAGGIETFFGSASDTVMENAQNAYKTAGMSANQYMQQVSSFATTLVNSVAQRGHEVAETSAADAQQITKEYSRALADQIEDLKYQQQDYMDAKREAQQQEIEDTQRAQQEETEAFQRATDERIKQINREYLEKIKLVDKEEYDRLKAIQDQIDGINEQGKKEKEAREKRERESKLAALREKEATATSYKDISDARKEMSELIQKYAEEDADKERQTRLDDLNKQKQEVKESANEKRNVLKEQQQQEVANYKDTREQELKALRESQQQQLEEIRKAHSEELKELQRAQAEQMKAAQRHNEDLLAAKKQMLAESQSSGKEFVKATEEDQAEAAELAQKAIVDMADNANKMGTSMDMIQNAYQGFAKQNFTMLDNLKLGFGGTKTEMERLLDTAEQIKASHGEMAEYSIDSFADIIDAIHVVQQEYEVSGYSVEELTQKIADHSLTEQDLKRVAQDLGISYEEAMQRMQSGALTAQDAIILTGTTSYEAASTIEGSTNRMKAAWENWIISLANPEMDLGETTNNLVDSVIVAAENIIPRVGEVLTRLGETIAEHVPDVTEKLGSLFYNSVPPEFQQTLDDLGMRLDDVASHWEPIIGKMQELADIVAPKVSEVLQYIYDNALTQALLPALGNLGDAISHLMDAMKDWVGPIMNIVGIIGNAFVGALGIAIDIISAAIEIIAGILNALKQFSDFLENTGKAIGDFANSAKGFFDDFGKNVENVVKSVIDWFAHLPENILNALGEIGQTLVKSGSDLLDGMFNGIKTVWNDVCNFFINLPQNVVREIGNLGNTLLQAGRDLIDGLIRGLTENPTIVTDTLWNIASGAVDGFKQFFGIASPSKLMRKLGGYVMDGYVEGLEKGLPAVSGIMSDMSDVIASSASTFEMGAVESVGGYEAVAYGTPSPLPPINIYMTYNAGEDAQELVYDMVGQLRRYGYTMGGRG